jgi:hypothetical protein
MQIEAQRAEVRTASVEIRTLTVDRRQLTMGTFRQIQSVPIYDSEGRIDGEPWGHVNYFPEKNGYGDAMHVVFTRAGLLCRTVVRPPGTWTLIVNITRSDVEALSYLRSLPRTHVRHRASDPQRHWTRIHQKTGDDETVVEVEWTAEYGDNRGDSAEVVEAPAALVSQIDAAVMRRSHVAAGWERLSVLPQLFIAT